MTRSDTERSVWERPEPPARPNPVPLSRERIVGAAMELADAEGLGAVSLRKVATALGAGPMRLYGYLATKDELLDLMADAVFAEIVAGEVTGDGWRAALGHLAHRTREAALHHEWFVELFGGRPGMGPNELAYLECALAALRETCTGIDAAMAALGTVQAYVVGAVRGEITERRAERASGLDKRAWQIDSGPYLRRMLDTGRYPTLAEVVTDARHPDPAAAFAARLDAVFDGVAARFAAGSG